MCLQINQSQNKSIIKSINQLKSRQVVTKVHTNILYNQHERGACEPERVIE